MLYGSVLFLVPDEVLHALPHDPIDRRAHPPRVLGARHLLQTLTMVALAALKPERRWLAGANALAAAASHRRSAK
jgi:hypothetical protein